MELSPLIKKIGHSLVEIRVRALKSIMCKLDHSLLSVSDLVQERMLFVYLLEWFNFAEVPMQEEVLQLISTLSKHPTAAQMLRDVGAVEFLTQLSQNLVPRLSAIIDGIFDLLFQLPELLPAYPVLYSDEPQLLNTATTGFLFDSGELLRDVIMQDFPAEIFLQRPTIVQNLLSLLRLSPGESDAGYLRMQAVACLHQLCVGLRRRLRFHQDPSFYSAKQDPVSQNSSLSYSREMRGVGAQPSLASSPGGECSPRPSVVGRTGQRPRGDGQDGDAASDSSGSSQRATAAALASGPNAPSPVNAAQLEMPDLGVEDVLALQLQQLSLAQFTVAAMEHAVPLLRTGRSGRLCGFVQTCLPREKLQFSMETLGDIMTYHKSCSSGCPESSLVHHRLAYMSTAVLTVRLLQTILPLEKANDHLPESTVAAILPLCLDQPFGLAYPGTVEAAVAYLEQVNPEGHKLCKRAGRAALWMESTCLFLKETQQQGEKNWLELLELADQATDGLPYHQHLPLIKECIKICSHLWKFEQASPLLQTDSQKVLLKLLSHPLLPVKTETYTCILNIVKECLGVQNVANPLSSVCSGVHFLLHPKVLYEISVFGLWDPNGEVNSAAKDILLFLLKGRLMMTPSTWDRLNQALSPVIPVLQSYAGTEDALGNCVLLISDVSNEVRDGVLPNTTKLRAALRLLFTKQQTLRAAAVQHLLPQLTNATARPPLDSVLACLPSLYCLTKTLDITLDSSDRSFLKVESVEKLFSILTSDTVDLTLRRSAAEQLGVVLQGELTLHILQTGMDCLLEPSVCVLRKLVYADPSLRHRLAENSTLLIALLRGGSHALLTPCVRHAKVKNSWNFIFSLPVRESSSHHAVSPYCIVLPLNSDLLSLVPAKEALQLVWNTAWHSGMDNLLEDLHVFQTQEVDLRLSETQVLSLRATHLPTGLRDCIKAIAMAAGHASVSSALSRLRLHLLIDKLALTSTHTHSCRDTLHSLPWQPAIARFLQVRPVCLEDERLLVDVVAFLNSYFKHSHSEIEDEDLRWILELLLKQTSSLLDLLLIAESQTHTPSQGETEELRAQISQRLQRQLTWFLKTLLHRLTQTTDRLCSALAGPFVSQLAVRLLQCLRVSDAPRFYGLPSLERTLLGMVSLTAQPGWSSHCPTTEPRSLCTTYLSGLLEVVSSFYVEWGGNSLSFMGKGVTKNAVVCLLHLSHEMMAQNKDKEFISQWSLGQEVGSDEHSGSTLGLAWLIPLWVDRDPEVRFASLGVGSALTTVPSGCQALSSSCQNISGGLWGTLLNIFLDQQESSMVRREAVFILQNLLVMPMPSTTGQANDSTWQSPCVHDDSSGVSLVGLPALQALLYHCQFFQHAAQMATSCYRGRYAFDLTPSARDPDADDSLGLWRSSNPAPQSRGSGSLSTSSTLVSKTYSRAGTSGDLPSGTDTSGSVLSLDSRLGNVAPNPSCVIVTPDLLSAVCGLLSNLLAVLPEFTLSALGHSQLLQSLARSEVKHCSFCSALLVVVHDSVLSESMVLTLLQLLSSFSKFLQSCVTLSSDLIGQMEFLKLLLANLFTILTLDTKDLGKNFTFWSRPIWFSTDLTICTLAVASDCRLAAVLHALWPWFLLDDGAMEAVLELLCVYTANCTTGQCLCVRASLRARVSARGSLMQCVMKLASVVAPDNSPIQQLAFSLLANLAINKDCKGVLQKSNFLQPLVSLPVPKPGSKTGHGPRAVGMPWLRLVLSMSFGEDGRLSILRLTGALDLLADLAATHRHRHHRHVTAADNALLILHNVCFSSANKPKVLANDKVMKVLVSCLESKEAEVCALGASALWALLHNYQKVGICAPLSIIL
uniref:Rotatin N-terminal domain-containing protein n=1 Tax=Esox lucius TaxID=8010 RepID=A0A6Q2WR56_ESOLU